MGLSFGSMNAQNVCFKIPDTKPFFDALKLPNLNVSLPKIGMPNFGQLGFGKLPNIVIPTINIPKLPSFSKLGFGGIADLRNRIAGLKVPITICINIGGDNGFDSIFNQVGDILNSLIPKLPSVVIPPLIVGKQISIIPKLLINPTLPLDLSLEQALGIVKDNCLANLLNLLQGIDPLERLKKLLELASELCSSMLFSQLRDVIDEIQRAQAEILANALSTITDPVMKLLKLIDMANDAFLAGAYDLLDEITKMISGTQFDALMQFLENLDPKLALDALMLEIKNLVQLQNFGPINQLLSVFQMLKTKLEGVTNIAVGALSLPELGIEALQNEINRLLDVGDILGIQKLMADFYRSKLNAMEALRELDPNAFLAQILPFLNDALKSLEFGLFKSLIKDLADKLCNNNTAIA